MRTFVAALAVCALSGSASAYSLFDFEGFAPGAYSSLTQTDAGLTLVVTRTSNVSLRIQDTQAFLPNFAFPLTWDNRCLSPFQDPTQDDWFLGNFSTAVDRVELEMTDFNADADDLVMDVWSGANGTGTLLASVTAFWGATETSPSYRGLGWNGLGGTPALSITFRGGQLSSGFPNSMFVDNIAATAVPEPATMAALGLGVAALLRRRRK